MEKKILMNAVRLCVAELLDHEDGREIGKEYLSQIVEAKTLLSQTRAIDLVSALANIERFGLRLVLDLRPQPEQEEKSTGRPSGRYPKIGFRGRESAP